MANATQTIFRVGAWSVEPARCRIVKNGTEEVLQPRWMDVLVLLAENAGSVVSTNDIIESVWGNVDVAQDSVYFTVSHLRKVLGEDDANPVYIETIAKRGYRLVAPVHFPEIAASRRRRIVSYAAGVAVVLLAGMSTVMLLRGTSVPEKIPNSIAIMPFVELGPGNADEFSLGFVDKLIIALDRVEGLEISARTSSFSLDARQATAREIGDELGVETILEGSLQRDGSAIEVNAQLIRTNDGLHIWADTYRFDIGAEDRIRTDIARQVAEGLGFYLPPAYIDTLDPLDAQIVLKTRVNSYTAGQQEWPRVHALSDGGYLILWRSWDQDGSNWGTYVQRYAESGGSIGYEYRLNDSTQDGQYLTELVRLADGRIAATWQAWEIDGNHWGVAGRVLAADGTPKSDEIVINDFVAQAQMAPDVVALPDGGFGVTYRSQGQVGPGSEIFLRIFDTNGNAVGPSLIVNSYQANLQIEPEAVLIREDRLLVVWQSEGADGSAYGIRGRIFDEQGAPISDEFAVSDFAANDQQFSDAVSLANGGAVVVWQSAGQDGEGLGGEGIFGQMFNSFGEKVGAEFQVNTHTEEDQRLPQVTAMPDGGFFVAWMSDWQIASGMDVVGQRFDEKGSPIGAEIFINVVTNSYQRNPSPAALDDGSVLVAFHADDWDGSYFGVFRRRLVFSDLAEETMVAKTGGDTFVFESPFAVINVTDFDPAIDRIDLSVFSTDFDSITIVSDTTGLIVDTGDGLVRLPGVTELQEGHFLF